MSNTSSSEICSTCANCGKGEEAAINLKACTACMLVKYCNRECQIAHRPQHKKACKKRAAELHDEKLFKQPPPLEDCPICMVRLPSMITGSTYMSCCGKVICCGCVYAFQIRAVKAGRQEEDNICPFCRTPPAGSNEGNLKRLEKRMELNDATTIYTLGAIHDRGSYGLRPNQAKALELYHRAGKLGNAEAYYGIGNAYKNGNGVERDMKKAVHYWELGAMRGDAEARNNLGAMEGNLGNMDRALKHWMIAARDGETTSMENIKMMYENGDATKDDYTKALRGHLSYLDEIKSDQRDEAAAFDDENKYYDSTF